MELIFGTLSFSGPNSFLMPGNFWLLLRRNFSDPANAGLAATNLIVNALVLGRDTPVAVTGERNVLQGQPVILMSDINATRGFTEEMANADITSDLIMDPRKIESEMFVNMQPEILLAREMMRRMQ